MFTGGIETSHTNLKRGPGKGWGAVGSGFDTAYICLTVPDILEKLMI